MPAKGGGSVIGRHVRCKCMLHADLSNTSGATSAGRVRQLHSFTLCPKSQVAASTAASQASVTVSGGPERWSTIAKKRPPCVSHPPVSWAPLVSHPPVSADQASSVSTDVASSLELPCSSSPLAYLRVHGVRTVQRAGAGTVTALQHCGYIKVLGCLAAVQ